MKPKTLSHGEIREILCISFTREEQNFSDRRNVVLLDSCQSINPPPPRPSFLSKYFQSYEPTSHFFLLPFVLANNNTLFFLDYFLFHRHVRSEQRKGFEISTRCLPNPCLTSVTKMYGCVESVCDGFPCAGGTCARARAQIIVRCIVKLAGHGVPLFVGTS